MPRRRRTNPDEGSRATAPDASLPVKDHILDRTVFLIGKKGTTDVTVREIAKEAGVNVAAVNYYFSSKEQMFGQMTERFLAGFNDVMRLLDGPDTLPEERLRRWSEEVMRQLADYPGFLAVMERHMTAEPLDPFGRALRESMKSAVRRLTATIRECVGPTDRGRIAFKLTLFISALAGPFPRLVGKAQARPGARESAARSQFLDLLLEHLRK
ncbi:MAG: TetR/AcrR family transcriptional regulator [Deltaproteobacteria bacterium]|nr:TetR/AcrR family transcriptional regulator [Deltaproteobacteria bacterium]